MHYTKFENESLWIHVLEILVHVCVMVYAVSCSRRSRSKSRRNKEDEQNLLDHEMGPEVSH